jgi:hypothetical protein
MTREANSSRTVLQRLQAERRRRDADPAAADSAAWTEHCVTGWMTDAAMGHTSEPQPPAPPEPPPAAPDPVPEAAAEAEPARDLAAEAEQYAAVYPERAGLIRAHGRVPDTARFGPPDDMLVRAIVAGHTPNLLAADQIAAERIGARDSVAMTAP